MGTVFGARAPGSSPLPGTTAGSPQPTDTINRAEEGDFPGDQDRVERKGLGSSVGRPGCLELGRLLTRTSGQVGGGVGEHKVSREEFALQRQRWGEESIRDANDT